MVNERICFAVRFYILDFGLDILDCSYHMCASSVMSLLSYGKQFVKVRIGMISVLRSLDLIYS